jgi:glycosyltransferase involved in cell wall biosynthesis
MESLKFLMTSTFYPPHHFGGDAIYVKNLASELSKMGHEVHVIYLLDSYHFKKGFKNRRQPSNFIDDNIHIYPLTSPLREISLFDAYICGKSSFLNRKIEQICTEINPNIVHHNNIAGFGPSVLKISGEQTIYTAHDYWAICQHGSLMDSDKLYCNINNNDCFRCSIKKFRPPQIWRRISNINEYFNNINTIISPSIFMKNNLSKILPSNKINVLPNFSKINIFNPKKTVDYNYFLFVGVLETHKGIIELIDQFSEDMVSLDLHLNIVGDGSLRRKISNQIEEYNAKDRINLYGKISDANLWNLYYNADSLIIPSIWPENCPLVALEALSTGLPIIGKNSGGIPEIVGKIDNNLIFNEFSDLKNVLNSFNKSSYPRNKILDIFEKNYSIQSYLKNYYKLIEMTYDDRLT